MSIDKWCLILLIITNLALFSNENIDGPKIQFQYTQNIQ